MDLLKSVLATLGGGAFVVGLFTAAVKLLLDRHLDREREVFRATIETEHAAHLARIKAELEREGRDEARSYEYGQIMRRYQGPLQHAVYDLQSRLYNIVCEDLIGAYAVRGKPHEREYVVCNTAFVIAQYFAWAEIIRSEIQFIDCATSENTRELSMLQERISSLWQTDRFGDGLMIWAGEQRALGEIMIEHRGERLHCIGYARFLERREARDNVLLERLHDDVERACDDIVPCYDRLVTVQHALIDLLHFLDPAHLRFPTHRRSKIERPSPTAGTRSAGVPAAASLGAGAD